ATARTATRGHQVQSVRASPATNSVHVPRRTADESHFSLRSRRCSGRLPVGEGGILAEPTAPAVVAAPHATARERRRVEKLQAATIPPRGSTAGGLGDGARGNDRTGF